MNRFICVYLRVSVADLVLMLKLQFFKLIALTRNVARRVDFYNLDAFLNINDRDILTHAGKISHDMACRLASEAYEKFNHKRIAEQDLSASDFDTLIHQLPDHKNQKS